MSVVFVRKSNEWKEVLPVRDFPSPHLNKNKLSSLSVSLLFLEVTNARLISLIDH